MNSANRFANRIEQKAPVKGLFDVRIGRFEVNSSD
jgi:hypothetical protein